jgi:6-pyruvoyltetrahydropterin/6-carboxytetrahydropterin synthase
MHGHLWKIQVTFGPYIERDDVGIAADFHLLKGCVQDLCEELDHTLLNDVLDKPTAENLVEWFHENITEESLYRIELWESPTSSCSWVKT